MILPHIKQISAFLRDDFHKCALDIGKNIPYNIAKITKANYKRGIKMKASLLISILVVIFGLLTVIIMRQPQGFGIAAAGAIMFTYFFLTWNRKKR